MLGELNQTQIDALLERQIIGRIGCHAFGRTYVVPITYAYRDGYVYAHGHDGMKLHMMRANPHVAFEVDCYDGAFNWESVIAAGTFEELYGTEAQQAMHLLVDRIERHVADPPGETAHPTRGISGGVVYRIKLEEKSGRFERRL